MFKNKIIVIINIIIVSFVLNTFSGCTSSVNDSYEYNYNDVKDILIRFHVVANSNAKEDQNIKIKIKDAVINYIFPYLKESKSLDESRKILKENEKNILEISNNILKENGYEYTSKINFSKENFPEKSYGSIILPAGEYEAFQIIIGEGKGHNWWCVMFPPMCFIDVTKGEVEEEQSKQELDDEIDKNNSEKENDEEEDEEDYDNQNDDQVEIKFKILEIFE